MEQSTGTGEAHDATVEITESAGIPPEVLNEEDFRRAVVDYNHKVEGIDKLKKKVTKFESHLEGAKEALANAEAELAATKKPTATAPVEAPAAETEGV